MQQRAEDLYARKADWLYNRVLRTVTANRMNTQLGNIAQIIQLSIAPVF